MTEQTFVYDTYALIEILRKNPNYEPYTEHNVIINDFIYAEYCYSLVKDSINNLEEYTEELISSIIHVDLKTIEEAMKFRYEHKHKKLSTTDCVSYLMAKKLGVKFLTGDKEFEHLENVEFVKSKNRCTTTL